MHIIRVSKLTGVTRTRDIKVTHEQLLAWHDGAFIQDAMPHLSEDEREFIMTGITQDEWDKAFGGEE